MTTTDDETRLSPREMEIARLLTRGCTNKAIAAELGISVYTVSSHLRRLFAKLDVVTRAGAVGAIARRTDAFATLQEPAGDDTCEPGVGVSGA